MAGELPPLVVEIQVELDKLKTQMSTVQSEIGKIGSAAEEQKSHVKGLGESFKEMGKVAAEAFAAAEIISFFKEAGAAAIEDSKSQALLTQQLKNSVGATKEQVDASEKSIKTMSDHYAVVESKIRPAFSLLARDTKNVGDATKLTDLAMNVSAGTGKDLQTVAIALAKAHDGNTGALQRLGVNVKNLKDPFTELHKQFDGMAQKAADTNPYQKMEVTFEHIKETLGKAVMPIFSAFAKTLDELMPIVEMLAGFIGKLVTALNPLIERLMKALMPVFGALINVILSLVSAVLPPLISILDNLVVPAIEWLAGYMVKYLIPAWNLMIQIFGKVVQAIWPLAEAIMKGIGKTFEAVWKLVEPVLNGLFKLLGIKQGPTLKIGLDTSALTKFNAGDFAGLDASALSGGAKMTGGGSTASSAVSAHAKAAAAHQKAAAAFTAAMTSATEAAVAAQTKYSDAVSNAQNTYVDAVDRANAAYNDAVDNANQAFADARANALSAYNDAVANAEQTRADSLEALQKSHADNLLKINQDYATKLADVIQSSMNQLRTAFANATKTDAGSMFADLAKNGAASADALLASLKDRLASIQKLASDAASLSGAGYSQTFIEQVISQGPAAGDEMAQALLAASPQTASAIQANFAAVNDASATGMDALSAQMFKQQGFATDALKQLYLQTQKDQADALAAENQSYVDAQANIQSTYTQAVAKAEQVRDAAYAKAQDALDKAMKSATDARDKALNAANDALQKAMDKAEQALSATLTSIQNKIDATVAKMGNLNANALLSAQQAVGNASTDNATNPGSTATADRVAERSVKIVVDSTFQTDATPSHINNAIVNGLSYSLPSILDAPRGF